MKKIVPGVCLMEGSKTAEKINEITNLLVDNVFDKNLELEKVFTTDNGPNIKAAFDRRIYCANHANHNTVALAINNRKEKSPESYE